jgi:radical SAM protein with 4Fe4S-binding SPASM domain
MKIQFESGTACNARCTFCPRIDMTRPQGQMSDELFHKIIKDGKEMRSSFFVPFLNGEPFIFPRIWQWLDYMRDEKVRVHIYTNAEFMDVDRLIEYSNISLICCSVNAVTKETYDKVVRGPDYEKVKANVEDLIKKSRKARVFVSMVVVEKNQHEVEMFKKMWGKRAILGEFKNWGGARHDKLEKNGEKKPCWALLNSMSILWDGRMVPCCMDYDGKIILGDANKQTLTEIWHGSQRLRNRHRKLDFSMEPCKNCNHNI